jgi:ribosomal protein S18 acetylase RimI-like enzyme
MTRDTAQISEEQQREFYAARIVTGQVEGFLMCDGGEPVAYGLIVWDDAGLAWSSTGVAAARRGEGFGRAVTVENVKRAFAHGASMYAEVRRDNAAQQKICLSIGYHVTNTISHDGETLVDVMRCETLTPGYA